MAYNKTTGISVGADLSAFRRFTKPLLFCFIALSSLDEYSIGPCTSSYIVSRPAELQKARKSYVGLYFR